MYNMCLIYNYKLTFAAVVKALYCKMGPERMAVNSLALTQLLPYHASQHLQNNIIDNDNNYSMFSQNF